MTWVYLYWVHNLCDSIWWNPCLQCLVEFDGVQGVRQLLMVTTFMWHGGHSLSVHGVVVTWYINVHHCCNVSEAIEPPIPMRGHNPTFITKWVDYSVKHGFGFQLTDGSVGVLFPDTTRMLLDADDRYTTTCWCSLYNNVVGVMFYSLSIFCMITRN